MLFRGQKVLAFAQRRALLVTIAKPQVTVRPLHSSLRCREQYLNASQKTFDDVVLNESASGKVILVDFYADWCGPCKMISPVLEKLTGDPNLKTGSGRSLDLLTIDTEREVGLAQKYQIRSLPTVMAFKDGRPVNQFIGALNEGQVKIFLQQL